ncbi:chromosome segregation protein SMC [Dulcicalothrix desertica PCC 7102]|uniref:Chromosome segregation protein SMC n=1 Tax=Dulcicalothrix desertica PCC 7102 TaxID=232991 RepID=A0A3S1IRM4_9CYAN|nr:AAA family ATPase [Dulcicalothrix desertica]RUT01252.1 chromosome segregation protein SMC [Dulcicalothrix desertica PCC 7102]TWH40597.1 putative ATPase [Dulcicalothrix desertica PCC 7102]
MTEINNDKNLSRIVLKGFKSIVSCDIELYKLNVLIGCNGAGKSNFISFFRMVQQLLEQNLQVFVSRQGGPDALLHFGRKVTEKLEFQLYLGNNRYLAELEPTQDNRLMFYRESFWLPTHSELNMGRGHFESQAVRTIGTVFESYVLPVIKQWRVYHFHDTSDSAYVKQPHGINDNAYLRPDARNLASFLYFLRDSHPASYQKIVKTIRLVAPFFGDFNLRPSPQNKDVIELEWFERGQDIPFKAHLLSDGTLRFICLATVFLQPDTLLPETILVDEPELGLHPYAITVLASLMRASSKQVIVSTQSVELLNEFDANDVIVVDRNEGKSSLHRLKQRDLESWLEDYSLGELWKKNIVGGRPSR